MLCEPFARDVPGLRLALPSEEVGHIDLLLFASADLRREPHITAVRDFLIELFGKEDSRQERRTAS
jgi:hypothetical protein